MSCPRFVSRTARLLAPLLTTALLLAGCDGDLITSDTCGVGTNEGGSDVPGALLVDLRATQGTFNFRYETRSAKDRMQVFYEGKALFDSGCVAETRDVDLTYGPGVGTTVEVRVTPNCDGTPMTSWKFDVACPEAPSVAVTKVTQTNGPEPKEPSDEPRR